MTTLSIRVPDSLHRAIEAVITEVRAIKRTISERHGNDIDRLLNALMVQERSTGIVKAEQEAGTGQPATPQSKSEGGDKPQPESEGSSR